MNTICCALIALSPFVIGVARGAESPQPIASAAWSPADVWLLSTRHIPSGASDADVEPGCWHLEADGSWTPSETAALLVASPKPVPLVIFIHGNRWDADRAAAEGLAFSRQLQDLAPAASFRFAIWSWPADRMGRRNRPDLIVKDIRSREEAAYLARLLDRVPPDLPVSLIGYSYGAQTILGALRLLAGDDFDGARLERHGTARQAPMAAILVAGAVESHALAGGDLEQSLLSHLSRLLVIRNRCDPNLRLYPFLYGRGGPQAMGFVGPTCLDPDSPETRKIEVLDVSCEVGKRHDWECYRLAPSFASRLAEYTFLRSARE